MICASARLSSLCSLTVWGAASTRPQSKCHGDTCRFDNAGKPADTSISQPAQADAHAILRNVGALDTRVAASAPATEWFTVQIVQDDEANAATLKLLDTEQRAPRLRQHVNDARGVVNCTVQVPAARLPLIAAQPDVISIHPSVVPRLYCERQDQIVAGNLTGDGSQPTGPGYLAWLQSNNFTQTQFTNSGFITVITDDGGDGGVAATPLNSKFRISNDAGQPSRGQSGVRRVHLILLNNPAVLQPSLSCGKCGLRGCPTNDDLAARRPFTSCSRFQSTFCVD